MSDIPYSVRDKTIRVNSIKGFNFDSLSNDELFKKQDSNNVTGTKVLNFKSETNNELALFTDEQSPTLVGAIQGESGGGLQKLYLNTTGDPGDGITITSKGRVGINISEPEEDLEIDGSIQIDAANVARLKFQKSGNPATAHALGEIDGEEDGTNGGDLQFYTKVDGDSVTEKLRINNVGAIGIGGANFGSSGQVLTSKGSGNSVEWVDQVSIGQSVSKSDSPSFIQLSLGVAGTNQGIINLQDFTNVGTDTVAQIKGILNGNNGGDLQFYTKVDGNSLTERMTIHQSGLVSIKTDFVGLLIATADGVTEQGAIYNSGFGTKDFVIDASVGSNASKGIAFRIAGNDKLKIGSNGEIGIGGANFGSSGQVLTSNGSGSSVSWASPIPYHLVFGLNPNSGSIYQFSASSTTLIDRLFVRTGESPTTTYNNDLTSSTYWSPSVSGIFQINIHAIFAASNTDQLAYSALLLEKSTTGSTGTFTPAASSTDRRFGSNQNATDAQAFANTNNISHTFNVATTDTFRLRVLAITQNNINPWIYADEAQFKVSITKVA